MDKTNLLKRLALGGALAGGLLGAGLAIAATNPPNPTAGTSTGDLTVTITVPGVVFVTGLDDIPLTYVVGGGNLSGSSDFCIWSNTGQYGLTLTSTSSAVANTFQAQNVLDRVDYTVDFDNSLLAINRTPMTESAIRNAIASSGNAACGADNASIGVGVAEVGNLDNAQEQGDYTDILVFLVTAQ